MIKVVIRDVDEIKLLCSLHKVMITFEVIISYVVLSFFNEFLKTKIVNSSEKEVIFDIFVKINVVIINNYRVIDEINLDDLNENAKNKIIQSFDLFKSKIN